ncbi:superoxide dismutase, Fe-Mn family [Salinibacillus kushneri]|uniref:superoxide dismutase n=1 Tax=Salinibacillus kushneri TaxID=237682 RepID=A0A1I0HY85_9BACI|nr:superoxide dismutase [Salinibacillus kushneri]SET89050.1 superoxide dismutase, Fe-Mn family [Salinibacillus kushneri]
MNAQTKQYLYALLNWADEIEEKVKSNQRNTNLPLVKSKLANWRNHIQKYITNNQSITQQDLEQIQNNGREMIEEILLERGNKQILDGVPIGEHKLPPLPYDYDALEPVISEEIMRLHHDVHHQSYVDGLNKAEQMIDKWSESQNSQMLRHWMREQSFNGSGHFLHTIFWNNMSPRGGGKPSGELAEHINEVFGDFNRFKKLFTNAAKSVQGTGWAMLVWELRSGRVAIQSIEKHNMYALWDVIPLLVLDVWEHAYYLQYKTDRAKYIDNWWRVVNWRDVQNRFNKAKNVTWTFA